MTDTTHKLANGDAALILHANGDVGMFVPNGNDDDELPDHVALALAFMIVAKSPTLSEIVMRMADAEAAETSVPQVTQ